MKRPIGSYMLILGAMAAMLALSMQPSFAVGSISAPGVTPTEGTANSVFRFRITYSDQAAGYTPRLPGVLKLQIGLTVIDFPLGNSRFQNGYNLDNGVELFLFASAGLDQKRQWSAPGDDTNKGHNGYFLPDYRVFYVPDLKAKANGDPNPDIQYWWYMEYTDPTTGTVTKRTLTPTSAPKIFDTTRYTVPLIDAYGGQYSGDDWMFSYPAGWPFNRYVDPLNVTTRTFPTAGEDPSQFPDEGSSTSTYTFMVSYDNAYHTPAKPWVPFGNDSWQRYATVSHNGETGVMLYIRNLDYANLSDTTFLWDGRMVVTERDYWKYFHGHHMYKENFTSNLTDQEYINYLLRVGPTSDIGSRSGDGADHWMTTWALTSGTNRYYEALPPGRYEYYFACSDDDYSAWDVDGGRHDFLTQMEETPPMPTAPPPHDYFFWSYNGLNYKRAIADDSPPSVTTWQAGHQYATGDFVKPTTQNGHKYICYEAGTSGGTQPAWPLTFGSWVFDGSVLWTDAGAERPGSFVDKKTYMPGAWTYGYPYDSWVGQSWTGSQVNMDDQTIQYQAFTYPIVDPGLFQVTPLNGGPKFLGTLSPYKRAVDPSVPNQAFDDPAETHSGTIASDFRLWAESAGGTDHDVYTFKVNYWQSAGIAPTYVGLYLKNGWNADDGQPFRYYSMSPSPGQTLDAAHYKTRVTYECQLNFNQLGRGSHCYYFEAADRQWTDARYPGRSQTVSAHVCRFPRRPDTTPYYGNVFYEDILPNKSPVLDQGIQFLPVENDIINGPWINTKPELVNNSWSVSPTSGPSGTNFRFLITYKDADNQRPYAADLIVETDDAGDTYTGSMTRAVKRDNPATPLVDEDPGVPADNLTREYRDGVVFEWNSSSSIALQTGIRRFKFAFIDNWGSPVDTNDRISGETVYAPQSGWGGSFVLTGNTAPRLTNGNVRSADGTSNEATTWNYTVTYTDADNQAPRYMLVFIGRQDSQPNGPIVWDSGHAMEQVNVLDNVYNHGVQFYYSTRLPGDSTTPIKYYHCYVASDGVDVADYNPTNSASSGMVWTPQPTMAGAETLGMLTTSPQSFTFAHHPLVTGIPASSELLNPTHYASPLIYHGSNLLTSGSDYTLTALAGTVNVTVSPASPASAVTTRYWFATEPGASGPLAVGGNNAPVLTDGQVAPAKGYSTTTFDYTVTYKDLDGQVPSFIHVVIDGVTHSMANVSGNTTYKEGVGYKYSTTLTSGNHSFYFEASDGSALTIFDSDPATVNIDPIDGPYVNDHPMFFQASINPPGSVNTSQAITYSISYRDNDNEGPNDGWPIVFVDNPTEQNWNGTAGAIGDNTITSSNPLEAWTVDQFAGMPVQVTIAGTNQRIVYKILSNTANMLTLMAGDVSSIVTIGSEFTIGKLQMVKQDETDQVFSDIGGVVYEAKVPSLGPGTHTAHFKAVTTEVVMPGQTQDYTLRYPATDDMQGPIVNRVAPPGNVAPTLTNGGSTPGTGTAGTPFRFTVTYTDTNGDPPTADHEGYINLVIDGTTYHMIATDAAPQYSLGAEYSYTLSLTTVGAHQYYFEASDGYFAVRLPSSGYLTAYISRPPILTGGSVTPTTGNTGRVYEYKVKYTDPDDNPPASVKLYIDSNPGVEVSVPMPGASYANGVVYSYPTSKNALSEGLHTFYFTATDGYGYAWYDQDVRDMEEAQASDPNAPDPVKNSSTTTPPTPVDPISGPSVHSNTTPTLTGGGVTPTTGYDLDTYIYTVTYRDNPDGDEPEFVEVYIDGSDLAHAFRMDKVIPSEDYRNGVQYRYVKQGFTPGSHSYFFKASDWLIEVTTTTVNGSPVVQARGTATITLSVPSSVVLGDPIRVEGYIRGYGSAPLSVTLNLALTKPGGAVTNVTVTSAATGYYQYTWTPLVTGTWTIQATWPGSSQYQASASPIGTLTATGPSTTVNGLDMISIPLAGISIFPDGVFGVNPPFAVAKWLPAKKDYKLYSLLPGIRTDFDFPAMATGEGYWIKTLEPKLIAPAGSLVSDQADFSFSLAPGWNQIGCPFTHEVDWSSLRVTAGGATSSVSLASAASSGWIKDYGWVYDVTSGNYRLVRAGSADHTLAPWKGYWIKANVNCTLIVPATRSISGEDLKVASEGSESATFSAPKWQVKMIARNGQLKDECNYFGASRSGDERIESPGCFENYVDTYFTTDKGGVYASDLRGNLSNGDSWQFKVDTDRVGEIVLEWDGLESVPSSARLVLVDLTDNKSMTITPGSSYRFRAETGGMSRSFRIDYLTK